MAKKSKKSSIPKEEPTTRILEGFTYEELPGDGPVPIEISPQIENNAIVIDTTAPVEQPVEKVSRRNNSRKVQLTSYIVNSDDLELPDVISLDYREYAELLKKYMFKGLFLHISTVLRDNMDLSDEEITNILRNSIPEYMKSLISAVLSQHKTVETITGITEVNLIPDFIRVANTISFIFPDHSKIYEAQDIINIPV